MLFRSSPSHCPCSPPDRHAEWFWCQHHQCRKRPLWQRLCRRNERHRAAWEAGNGLGQLLEDQSDPAAEDRFRPAWQRFLKAWRRHAQDWFRRCSRRQIQARLAICRGCEQFTGAACRRCGCPVNRLQVFRNKLAWRSEECPLGKWPSLATHRWGPQRGSALPPAPPDSVPGRG